MIKAPRNLVMFVQISGESGHEASAGSCVCFIWTGYDLKSRMPVKSPPFLHVVLELNHPCCQSLLVMLPILAGNMAPPE